MKPSVDKITMELLQLSKLEQNKQWLDSPIYKPELEIEEEVEELKNGINQLKLSTKEQKSNKSEKMTEKCYYDMYYKNDIPRDWPEGEEPKTDKQIRSKYHVYDNEVTMTITQKGEEDIELVYNDCKIDPKGFVCNAIDSIIYEFRIAPKQAELDEERHRSGKKKVALRFGTKDLKKLI